MSENESIEQLFYDLYNNTKNEKADDREFELLYVKNYNIAKIHYDILMMYIKDLTNKKLEKLANDIQNFVVSWVFK